MVRYISVRYAVARLPLPRDVCAHILELAGLTNRQLHTAALTTVLSTLPQYPYLALQFMYIRRLLVQRLEAEDAVMMAIRSSG